MIDAADHTGKFHLLPLYLTKLASSDLNSLDYQSPENFLLKDISQSELTLKRGIRTLGEAAHFVRSIPTQRESDNEIWSPPPILLT